MQSVLEVHNTSSLRSQSSCGYTGNCRAWSLLSIGSMTVSRQHNEGDKKPTGMSFSLQRVMAVSSMTRRSALVTSL